MPDNDTSPVTDFGHDNMGFSIDARGIVTIQFDSNRTLAKAGERNKHGVTRRCDLIATSAGFFRIGTCQVSMNAIRA